nr:MAG TPA: cell division cylcle protein 20 [Caudoviricetes sp.]
MVSVVSLHPFIPLRPKKKKKNIYKRIGYPPNSPHSPQFPFT